MSTITGLPAHILLLHFVVVLVPLTAILLIICALWPTARQRLIWLVVVLAGVTLIVTPLTVKAGEWFGTWQSDHGYETPELDAHMDAGEHGIWMALAVAVAAALLAAFHVRGRNLAAPIQWALVAVVIALSGFSMFEIHTIGESGARAAWGTALSTDASQ
ncbi:hypothetical protein KIH27_20485 [Mycobacterium sp. M1]|uniref:DUF2231 domain-containing protein n=1 Tax=Mycolicibacter acidiphilus TaxID=2835306 RepID=A0ABS5RNS7_9MYCO|nr:hypothetical protein [Mycolicibacter acidiphilus]MBS9535965.1 hypothetical protein [Mycolicibacter acidiphilus]